MNLTTQSSLEAQIAAISDDIAYNCHDIDDGIRANLFTLNDPSEIDLIKKHLDKIYGLTILVLKALDLLMN